MSLERAVSVGGIVFEHPAMNAALENIATPEGRDISQSSVERHILPDGTSLLHYMAFRTTNIVEKLVVFPDRMRENLEVATFGTWAGQPVRTALMAAGVDYDMAYEYVQAAAFEALHTRNPLLDVLAKKPLSDSDQRTAVQILGSDSLARCFDYKAYISRGIEHIYKVNGLV